MTACCCRLIQPEKSTRKKASGGGSGSMGGSLTQVRSGSKASYCGRVLGGGFTGRRFPDDVDFLNLAPAGFSHSTAFSDEHVACAMKPCSCSNSNAQPHD